MLELELPTVGLEIEIWPKNFVLLHGGADGEDVLREERKNKIVEELGARASKLDILQFDPDDGGIYEVKTQPCSDLSQLKDQLEILVDSNLVPEQSEYASSLHVNLGLPTSFSELFEKLHANKKEDGNHYIQYLRDLASSSLFALRLSEALGSSRSQRLQNVYPKVVSDQTTNGWNCRGFCGVHLDILPTIFEEDSRNKTNWIGDNIRVEYRTPCYKDIDTTISTVAILQTLSVADFWLRRDESFFKERTDLLKSLEELRFYLWFCSIHPLPLDAKGDVIKYEDYDSQNEMFSRLVQSYEKLKVAENCRKYSELLDRTNKAINVVRNILELDPIELSFTNS